MKDFLSKSILKLAKENPQFRKAITEELARFERGEDVPLEELPEELQDNVKDPPPSVKRLTEKMKRKKRR